MSWWNHLTKFSNESYRHFLAKSALFWILRDMKHEIATEWKVPNGYVDLCDKSTMTFYEIEFSVSPKFRSRKIEQYKVPGFEIIIIDCSKMPDDIDEIRRFFEDFIIPD